MQSKPHHVCDHNDVDTRNTCMIWTTVAASLTLVAKHVRQSKEAQAGTTPVVLTRPTVAFSPTQPLNPAGMRPVHINGLCI